MVERRFAEHIESRVELIPEIGRYIQSGGGKRVRPAITLLAAQFHPHDHDQPVTMAIFSPLVFIRDNVVVVTFRMDRLLESWRWE